MKKPRQTPSGKSSDVSNVTSGDTIKKEEFRKYLENDGTLDFVTRKLIGLYKESDKPSGDEFLKNNFNGKEAEEEKKRVQELQKDKQKMQEQIDKSKLVSSEYDALKLNSLTLSKSCYGVII